MTLSPVTIYHVSKATSKQAQNLKSMYGIKLIIYKFKTERWFTKFLSSAFDVWPLTGWCTVLWFLLYKLKTERWLTKFLSSAFDVWQLTGWCKELWFSRAMTCIFSTISCVIPQTMCYTWDCVISWLTTLTTLCSTVTYPGGIGISTKQYDHLKKRGPMHLLLIV
jgi:hypothetical protein